MSRKGRFRVVKKYFSQHMKRIILPLLALLAASTKLAAQDESLTKTVEVLRPYEPTIPEAYKINPIPRIDDTAKVTAKFSYPLRQSKPLTESYLTTPVPPARVQRERYNDKVENGGYVRLGLGYKPTTMLDLYVGSERAKTFVWDIYANHYGNYGDVKNEAKAKVPTLDMRNEVGAVGQYNFERAQLLANVGFHRHDVRFYGYDTKYFTLDDYKNLSKDASRQHFNRSYASLEYKSRSQPDTTWSFGGTFNFYDYRSRLPKSEDALEFELYAYKQLLPSTQVGLTVNTDVYVRNKALTQSSNTIVSVIPELQEKRDWWQATAKLNLTFDNFSGGVKTYFYPVLNFTALLTDGVFLPYVEVSGEHQANTYNALTTENPYLDPQKPMDMRNTQKALAFSGGIKGKIASVFSYNLGLSYAFVNDMYFYATSTDTATIGNYFDVLYDDIKQLSFVGSVRFQPSRACELEYALRYDSYNMDKLPVAYNRPSLSMKLEATYNLWNKLNMYANADLRGSYKARDWQGVELKRSAGFDLSLGADYRFYNRSSVFLQLNNILGTRNQILNNYPTYRFNVLVGYTCVF